MNKRSLLRLHYLAGFQILCWSSCVCSKNLSTSRIFSALSVGPKTAPTVILINGLL
jgi:hypothetical protein